MNDGEEEIQAEEKEEKGKEEVTLCRLAIYHPQCGSTAISSFRLFLDGLDSGKGLTRKNKYNFK